MESFYNLGYKDVDEAYLESEDKHHFHKYDSGMITYKKEFIHLYKRDMTKAQAQVKLAKGFKITHKYFEDNEYIYIKNNQLLDEDNNVLDKPLFWSLRRKLVFDNGWSVFSLSEKLTKHLTHSLGVKIGDKIPKEFYRNYSAYRVKEKGCEELVKLGFMTNHIKFEQEVYNVTEKGINFIKTLLV